MWWNIFRVPSALSSTSVLSDSGICSMFEWVNHVATSQRLGGHLYKMKDSVTNIMYQAGRSPGFFDSLTSGPTTNQSLDFRLPSSVQNTHEFFPIKDNLRECHVNHLRSRASIPQAYHFHDVAALSGPAVYKLAQQ